MGKYEEPTFNLIYQEKDIEIREYAPFVTVATSDQTLSGSGFNRLFSFISGQNQASKKMAMTIPVINDATEKTMEFVLPLEIDTVDKAPLPNSDQLTLKQYPKENVAVISFSGRMNPELIEEKLNELHQAMKALGHPLSSNYRLARYNPPFSLPFLRRNEILCTIEDKDE